MQRVLGAVVLIGMAATAARASPWWATFDGNDYPENEGWLQKDGGTPFSDPAVLSRPFRMIPASSDFILNCLCH